MGQETFGRPAALGRPAIWARPTTKQEIMRNYRLTHWFQENTLAILPAIREWRPGVLRSRVRETLLRLEAGRRR